MTRRKREKPDTVLVTAQLNALQAYAINANATSLRRVIEDLSDQLGIELEHEPLPTTTEET